MGEALKPCCEELRESFRRRAEATVTSYPVIKDLPCPVCKQIVPVRIYRRPGTEGEAA